MESIDIDQHDAFPCSRVRPTPQARILWDVVAEHLDEGAFELGRLTRAHQSPAYVLDEVADALEPRLFTHIEAVRLTGSAGFARLIAPTLAEPDAHDGEAVGLAALVALADGHWDALRPAIWEGTESSFAAVLRAVELYPGVDTDRWVHRLADPAAMATGPRRVRALRLAAARQLPVEPLWASLQASDEPEVTAAAAMLRWVPWESYSQIAQHVARCGPAPARLAAALALLQWQSAAGLPVCQALLPEGGTVGAAAMAALALLGGPREHALLFAALTDATLACAAIRAVGFSGNVAAIESLIELIGTADQRISRLAAEAFALITGFDSWDARHQLRREPPEDEAESARALPGEADDLDTVPALTAADELPLVDANAARRFWDERRGSFRADRRYLTGDPDLKRALLRALRYGRMRDRHALALSLAVRSSGRAVLGLRGLARVQRTRCAELGQLPEVHLFSPVAGW